MEESLAQIAGRTCLYRQEHAIHFQNVAAGAVKKRGADELKSHALGGIKAYFQPLTHDHDPHRTKK